MGMVKRLGRNERVRSLLCRLAAWYMKFVFATSRWSWIGREHPDTFWRENRPFIMAMWHGRLFLMMPSWFTDSMHIRMLASHHRDGQLVAQTIAYFGLGSVTGSSSKGGSQALRAMLKALKDGEAVGITPDGPRGPRMRATEGIIALARLSGCPILPATASIRHGFVLDTWDRFVVPLPFSKGVFAWGEPIEVAEDAALDQARILLEERLNALTQAADRKAGLPPVLPADPTP